MFELGKNNRPTDKKLVNPNYKFLVKNGEKVAVNFSNMLTENKENQDKQVYLMEIAKHTTNPLEAKQIYEQWDWLEFTFYSNSILTSEIL